MNSYRDFPVVWLKEYRTFGVLFVEGAYVSEIHFNLDGEETVEQIENDEWEYWNDHGTDYESE